MRRAAASKTDISIRYRRDFKKRATVQVRVAKKGRRAPAWIRNAVELGAPKSVRLAWDLDDADEVLKAHLPIGSPYGMTISSPRMFVEWMCGQP
jgi:hypothetical protein